MAEGFGPLDRLPLNGSQAMTGPLTLAGNPTANLHAVPLQWILQYIPAVALWTGSTWPTRPPGFAVVFWIGATTTSPFVAGSGGALPNDVWLQNTL